MRHLLQCWGEVAPRLEPCLENRLVSGFRWHACASAPHASRGRLSGPAENGLWPQLSRSPRFFIWIISGRRQSDIRDRIGVRGIRYLGLHGWEGRHLGPLPEASSMALAGVKSWAGGLFANSPNVWIEDKGLSVADSSSRGRRRQGPPVEAMIESMVEPFKDVLRIAPGQECTRSSSLGVGGQGCGSEAPDGRGVQPGVFRSMSATIPSTSQLCCPAPWSDGSSGTRAPQQSAISLVECRRRAAILGTAWKRIRLTRQGLAVFRVRYSRSLQESTVRQDPRRNSSNFCASA